ncbi:MAG: phage major capsid protein [Planctomycetes bacterium]|nr:phage major capsid protein [Planctomycetota bacterium]
MADPGASAPSSFTVNYDSLLSTTLFGIRPKMVDNIFRSSAFMAALRQYGGVDYQDGGERIQSLLMYEGNDTFRSYSGYDQLIIKPQDGMTSAFFDWREIGGSITISRLEERQNSGEAQILNLLQQKIKQAEMSIKQKVNADLVQGEVSTATFVPVTEPVNGSFGLNPIGYFLPKNNNADPLAGGNVGNISRATYAWWRPHTAVLDNATKDTGNSFALDVTSYTGLRVALYRMYNYCSRGADGSAPNIILTNQETFETYENSLDQQKRYQDESLTTMGFDNVKVKGATIVWDELVPDIDLGTTALTDGSAFFINTNFYKLVIDKQTDFITTPFVEPENQTAKSAKVLFMGNTIVTNPRKLGQCCAIALNITS